MSILKYLWTAAALSVMIPALAEEDTLGVKRTALQPSPRAQRRHLGVRHCFDHNAAAGIAGRKDGHACPRQRVDRAGHVGVTVPNHVAPHTFDSGGAGCFVDGVKRGPDGAPHTTQRFPRGGADVAHDHHHREGVAVVP